MNRIAQAILYALFAAGLGYFSLSPAYQYSDADKASIKVSFSHAATRVEECVKLTPQEINDRALAGEPISECERERLPIRLELEIDGAVVYYVDAEPSGLWNDGPAAVYLRFDIDPGPHTITARLRDTARETGWDYTHTEETVLLPGRYFTITFRAETGGFRYR